MQRFVESMFTKDMHARRVLSLGHGVLGVLHAASLAIHAIGSGLAAARGGSVKHAVKQVDRMLANVAIAVSALFPSWVRFVVAARTEIMVTLDWTEFDADGHATIALNLVTSHGRATPLLWKTVDKSELKGGRKGHEDLGGAGIVKAYARRFTTEENSGSSSISGKLASSSDYADARVVARSQLGVVSTGALVRAADGLTGR